MDQLILLSLVVLGLPLLAFVLVIFNQRALGERAHLISIPILSFSFALALYVAWMKLKGAPQETLEWTVDWIRVGSGGLLGPLAISHSVLLDNITVILMVVVTLVSLLTHVFSSEYMKHDERYSRYFAFLGLFTFAMLGVILAGNFFELFIFWELVGFCSYVLIGHWYERPAPQYASKKAFIVNRIGDAVFWIGILLLFSEFRTFNYREIFGFISEGLPLTFSLLGLSPETTLTIAGLMLFAGAVAKSAQFPLHVWLSDAMEGPTPISALIHAATMVAAGVYLMARVFPLLTSTAMLTVACTGAFTALFAGTIAITQRDIKRVLAYSTISQLGLMLMVVGAGAVAAGIFHLVAHAAFKACLFLGAGSVIHAMHKAMVATNDHETDAQDMHNMGGLLARMPITGWTFIIAALAMSGVPLFAAFLSKDEILAGTMAYGTLQGGIAQALPWIGLGATFLTALYMWRQVFFVFFGTPKKPELHAQIAESPKMMTVPLLILAVLCFWIWSGPNPIDPESGWFLKRWVQTPAQIIPPQSAPKYRPARLGITYAERELEAESEFGYTIAPKAGALQLPTIPMPHQLALEQERQKSSLMATAFALGSAVLGFVLAWFLVLLRPDVARAGRRYFRYAYHASERGWFVDDIYEYAVEGTVLFTSRAASWVEENVFDRIVNLAAWATVLAARIAGWFDRYVVDGIVTLVGATVQFFGLMTRSVQTGRIQTYLAWVVAGVVILIIVVRYVM